MKYCDGEILKMCSQKGNKPTQFLKNNCGEQFKHICILLSPLKVITERMEMRINAINFKYSSLTLL